jgi:hypothetical protein
MFCVAISNHEQPHNSAHHQLNFEYVELLEWFIESCWQRPVAAIAEGLCQQATLQGNFSRRKHYLGIA